MKNDKIRNLTLSAMFLAIGQILPFVTGQIPAVGKMLSPMHIPIYLCGFLCGNPYAIVVGAICPLLRSVLFGMPVLYPSGVGMAFELATYGFLTAFLAKRFGTKSLRSIYLTLILAMIGGRIVWGLAQVVLLGLTGQAFTVSSFIAGAFTKAIPGIILHLLLVPFLVRLIKKRSDEL